MSTAGARCMASACFPRSTTRGAATRGQAPRVVDIGKQALAVHLAPAVLIESLHPRRRLYPVCSPYGHIAHVLVGLRYVAAVGFETSVVDNRGPSCDKLSSARLAKQLCRETPQTPRRETRQHETLPRWYWGWKRESAFTPTGRFDFCTPPPVTPSSSGLWRTELWRCRPKEEAAPLWLQTNICAASSLPGIYGVTNLSIDPVVDDDDGAPSSTTRAGQAAVPRTGVVVAELAAAAPTSRAFARELPDGGAGREGAGAGAVFAGASVAGAGVSGTDDIARE